MGGGRSDLRAFTGNWSCNPHSYKQADPAFDQVASDSVLGNAAGAKTWYFTPEDAEVFQWW